MISLAMADALEGPPPGGGREYSVYWAASFLRSSISAFSGGRVEGGGWRVDGARCTVDGGR